MDSILKHLYEGELYPEEKIVSTDPKYHSLVREINEEQNYLYELLDETDGRRLEHLGKLWRKMPWTVTRVLPTGFDWGRA